MDDKHKTFPVIAFVVVVVLFLIFGGGMMTGWTGSGMMGGGMMSGGNTGGGSTGGWTMGGINWMWFPTLLFLGLGVLLGWLIWGKK